MTDLIQFQFNTTNLSIGEYVIISGTSQDHWYFEHTGVIKTLDATEIVVTYHERLTKKEVDFIVSIQDVIKGRTSIKKLMS